MTPLNPSLTSPLDILSSSLLKQQLAYISSITELPITPLDNLPSNSIDPYPSFNSASSSLYPRIPHLFTPSKFTNSPFAQYIEGQFFEYGINTNKNLASGYSLYQKGAQNNELGCLFKLIRIHSEPELAKQFSQPVNLIHALKCFISIFTNYGLFSIFSSKEPAVHQFGLFNLYMDLNPKFATLVNEAETQGVESRFWIDLLPSNLDLQDRQVIRILLRLLVQAELYSQQSVGCLQELKQFAEENNHLACFWLADLMDVAFFGMTAIHDLGKRIDLYSKAERATGNKTITGRLISLFESLLRYSEVKRLQAEHIQQNIDFYHKKLQKFQSMEG